MTTDADRWQWMKKYFDGFKGDVFKYDDGSFMFSSHVEEGTQGGKDLESFVDRMIRKEEKEKPKAKCTIKGCTKNAVSDEKGTSPFCWDHEV